MRQEEVENLQRQGYFVGIIEGAECRDLKSTIANIAVVFQFPSYYGENLDAFWECINDLEWITETNYAIIIQNSALLMGDDTLDNKLYLMNLLNDVTKEWERVPKYKGEDLYRQKADFKVIYN